MALIQAAALMAIAVFGCVALVEAAHVDRFFSFDDVVDEAMESVLGCVCYLPNLVKPPSLQITCDEESASVTFEGLGTFTNELMCHRRGFPPSSPAELNTKFHLYTRTKRTGSEVTLANVQASLANFSPANPTTILIHGFLSSADEDWVQDMKDALLTKGDFNVITVDWERGAFPLSWESFPSYCHARQNLRVVARQVVRLLRDVIKASPGAFRLSDVHIIGHSLGGQMAGYVGQELDGIGRISALDPAKPGFEGHVTDCRLDEGDARFVDVIHTNSEDFGIKQQVGHVDFYPNYGKDQPACKREWYDLIGLRVAICSHSLVLRYYTDSILRRCSSSAYPCSLAEDENKCVTDRGVAGVKGVAMGYDAVDTPVSKYGAYAVLTKPVKVAPFWLND